MRRFAALLLATALSSAQVAAQQPDPTRTTLELLNDGPSYLKTLCRATVFGDGTIPNNPVVAKCTLQFQPKQTWNVRLLITNPANFHILDQWGAPCTPYNVWNDQHLSTTSMWVGIAFMNCNLTPGMSTELVSNDVPGNAVWIDAR